MEQQQQAVSRHTVSRRTVLRWASGIGAATTLERFELIRFAGAIVAEAAGPPITFRLVRPDDQLDVVIGLVDATLAGDVVTPSGANPLVMFTFGPQHVAERGYTATVPLVGTGAITSLTSGPSVVVVPLTAPVDFTVEALLALADAPAGVNGESIPFVPDGSVTALELPTGLVLSPSSGTRMRGPAAPRTVGDVSEVWIGRLETATGAPVELYAIQNRSAVDLVANRVPDAATRDDLVDNSTSLAPITASRLWLSSSGAFGKLRGDWPTAALTRYRHDITSGRDLVAQSATAGYLVPFGHRATIVTIAERRFATDTSGGQVSVMHLQRYLDILTATVANPRLYDPDAGRGLPFVEITASASETTPISLVPVVDTAGVTIAGVNDLRAKTGGADIMVQYQAVDRAGNSHSFALPATFISDTVAYRTGAGSAPRKLITVSNTAGRASRRTIDLGGRPLAFADPIGGDAGGVSKPTHTLVFGFARPTTSATQTQLTTALMPGLVATVVTADITDDSVSALSGSTAPFEVALHPRWLSSGNAPANFDLSFLRLATPTVGAVGAGTPGEAVATLEMNAEVFNQTAGVGLDLPDASSPWDPVDALGDAAAIFGTIKLVDIIDAIAFDPAEVGIGIPGTIVTIDANTVIVEFSYKPTLKSAEQLGFIATPATRCCVIITTTASIDGSTDPVVRTEMTVSDFHFVVPPLAPAIDLDVAKVSVVLQTGQPVQVVPEVRSWSFTGLLSYLQELADLLSGMGLGIDLEIRDDALDLGGDAGLPDFNLGIVEVSNVNVHLGIVLPLDGGPVVVSMGLGSRSHPIDVNVAMFGGTFWMELEMKFGDVPNTVSYVGIGVGIYWQAIDLNLIVIRITVTLMLTADFALRDGLITFTGAVALIGEIEILGLLSASASLVASLTYREATETIVLNGTVYYEIGSVFGHIDSGSVGLGSHTFPVGNGSSAAASAARSGMRLTAAAASDASADASADGAASASAAAPPSSFADLYSSSEWTEYCNAFV